MNYILYEICLLINYQYCYASRIETVTVYSTGHELQRF